METEVGAIRASRQPGKVVRRIWRGNWLTARIQVAQPLANWPTGSRSSGEVVTSELHAVFLKTSLKEMEQHLRPKKNDRQVKVIKIRATGLKLRASQITFKSLAQIHPQRRTKG